jgi:peptide-methionine (S)-S-oxide reductase
VYEIDRHGYPATKPGTSVRVLSFMNLKFLALIALFASFACSRGQSSATSSASTVAPKRNVGTLAGGAGHGTPLIPQVGHELAAFAEGCFWGSENTFRHVTGVVATTVGYAGGSTENPSYEDVCSHTTGHAEVVLVEFDPAVVSYEKLVDVFFGSHDPTTKDRQGPDVGDQYRSAAFHFNEAQREILRKAAESESRDLGKPVTTQVAPMPRFWIAEDYHQQYDEKSGRESCPLPRKRVKS